MADRIEDYAIVGEATPKNTGVDHAEIEGSKRARLRASRRPGYEKPDC